MYIYIYMFLLWWDVCFICLYAMEHAPSASKRYDGQPPFDVDYVLIQGTEIEPMRCGCGVSMTCYITRVKMLDRYECSVFHLEEVYTSAWT